MSDESLDYLEEFFLALSDGTRLRLLGLMRPGEVSVGFLSEQLAQSQPKISRHLAFLRSAGLVDTRRDGKWIYYRIAPLPDPRARIALNAALDWLAGPPGSVGSDISNEAYSHSDGGGYTNDIEIYLL